MEACHSPIKKGRPVRHEGELLEQIYNETEGNPFLLNEYIAMLQRGESLDHLPLRPSSPSPAHELLGLSQEALELAEVLSCFYDGAPLSSAAQILGKNASDLLAPLEQLENRGSLPETHRKSGRQFTLPTPSCGNSFTTRSQFPSGPPATWQSDSFWNSSYTKTGTKTGSIPF